jgi:hypothetical protein
MSTAAPRATRLADAAQGEKSTVPPRRNEFLGGPAVSRCGQDVDEYYVSLIDFDPNVSHFNARALTTAHT